MSTVEAPVTESQARVNAALDERLNQAFQQLGLGRVGSEREGGGKVTAFDLVESYRRRTAESTEKETTAVALAGLLKANEVPTEKAVEIGIVWGARYGAPEQDFNLNIRPHTQPDFQIKTTPRPPQAASTDFPVTIKPRT